MKLKYLSTKDDLKKFIGFTKEVYRDDPLYRDAMSSIAQMFLSKKTAYLEHARVYPVWVENNGGMLARAAFIIDYKQEDMLIVSFFEAKRDAQKAVNLIISEAKKLAEKKGLKRIVIGLDAHLNYRVGFLASHFNETPTFGLAYNPDYYSSFFSGCREYNFSSFSVEIDRFNMEKEKPILSRIKQKGFTFRFADLSRLDREIEIYTYLNNLCFRDHLWWADRTVKEDLELFHPFRWFLKGENLIFAEKEGQPIGMMLWYPDFNQLLPQGKGLGLKALVQYKMGLGKIDKFKIAEIAVGQKYQGSGAVLGFFDLLYSVVKDKYKICEAGWVEENNIKSRSLGIRWEDFGCQEYKKFKAYEVLI
ncbi:MAG: hypothetical protein VR72_03540 [Clostridiaceae bacterium BRH_c20a]|nr:MAG: hypothetical protein VR72_03540 [Clostridiaceae bacterium BRH_c20a]